MKKFFTAFVIVLFVLSGCADNPPETEPTADTSKFIEVTMPPSVPFDATLPEDVVLPGEMPTPGDGDAEIPPQPQPTIHDK